MAAAFSKKPLNPAVSRTEGERIKKAARSKANEMARDWVIPQYIDADIGDYQMGDLIDCYAEGFVAALDEIRKVNIVQKEK